jgi:hypothetical protein
MNKAKYRLQPNGKGLREIVLEMIGILTKEKKEPGGKNMELYVSNLDRFFEFLALDRTIPKISRKELKTFMGAKVKEMTSTLRGNGGALALSLHDGDTDTIKAVTREDCINNGIPMPRIDKT